MTLPANLIQRIRNTPVRELVRALERDGFSYRSTKGSGRFYRHADGRRALVHYHSAGDTLPMGTLRNLLLGTGWTEQDLTRLGLL